MVKGLHEVGWMVDSAEGVDVHLGEDPGALRAAWARSSSRSSCSSEAKIAVAPGIGFGDYGDDHVRIALIENEHRLRQAMRGITRHVQKGRLAGRPA